MHAPCQVPNKADSGAICIDILKGNKCYPGCCPGTYTCDAGCVCMTSAQKELVGTRRGGNRTQYDHNNDF